MEAVFATELTVRKAGVSFLTVFRGDKVGVEHSHGIDIERSLFSAVDNVRQVTEQASGFPCFADEDIADHAIAVVVDPVILLRDSVQDIEGDSGGDLRVLVEVSSVVEVSSKSLVERLEVETISKSWVKSLNESREDLHHLKGQTLIVVRRQTGEVVNRGI